MRKNIAFALALFAGFAGCQTYAPADDEGGQLIQVWVDEPPTLAPLDSVQVLAYELHLTSASGTVAIIRRIEVLRDDSADSADSVLMVLSDSALSSALRGVGDTTDFLDVRQGPRVVAYMWVPLNSEPLPKTIRHRIRIVDERGIEHDVDVESTPVQTEYALIAPPVRGSHWLAGNGPSNESAHRRYIFAHSGKIVLWERFAIDFQLVDSAGRNMRTDGLRNVDHYSYDQPVYAVADGKVVGVRSDFPDNTPNESPEVPPDFDTVMGNHVTLDIGSGRYVVYAHLRRGSVTVEAGDNIQRGRELARIGNSGFSNGPHLHFHISDQPGVYAGEGLPFAFESYEVIGECDDTACTRRAAGPQRRALPRDGQLLSFDR